MIPLPVDFNDLDEQGRVLALCRLAPDTAEVGAWAYLLDDEGNSCSGTIASIEGALIHVDADWDTWSPASDLEVQVAVLPREPQPKLLLVPA
jgi:hypothetical protein